MGDWGYPVAGFSAKSYLKRLGYLPDTPTPRHLQVDFQKIIEKAEADMVLPAILASSLSASRVERVLRICRPESRSCRTTLRESWRLR